eukprot:2032459-Prymnesium_polylepis.1
MAIAVISAGICVTAVGRAAALSDYRTPVIGHVKEHLHPTATPCSQRMEGGTHPAAMHGEL